MGRRLLQTDRNAGLLIDVLRSLVAEKEFELHDFVVMPDHVHLLFTIGEGMTVEVQVPATISIKPVRVPGAGGDEAT